MVTDEPLGLILRAIALDPCDPFLRRVCADRAEEVGNGPVAKLQRWVADILEGNHRFHVVVTRSGSVVPASGQTQKLRTQDRNYWLRVAARLFKEYPDAALVIVDRRPMTTCGLRVQKAGTSGTVVGSVSPILFYRSNWKPWGGAKNRQTPRVVPGPILSKRRRGRRL